MTDATRHQAHKDLSGVWIGKIELLNNQRPAKLLEHSGTRLHGLFLSNASMDRPKGAR
jgi:hypothetical protein